MKKIILTKEEEKLLIEVLVFAKQYYEDWNEDTHDFYKSILISNLIDKIKSSEE